MSKSVLALITLTLLLSSCLQVLAQTENIDFAMSLVRGRVFLKSPDKEPFDSRNGLYRVPVLTSIISLPDGQCFMQVAGAELRMKQETILALIDDQTFELRQGLAGFRVGSDTARIKTPHLGLELADALVVVKTNPVLTRVCVVKGQAVVTQGRSTATVTAGQEIAAAPQRLSQVYKQSDELRFTWYWVNADKEPALQ